MRVDPALLCFFDDRMARELQRRRISTTRRHSEELWGAHTTNVAAIDRRYRSHLLPPHPLGTNSAQSGREKTRGRTTSLTSSRLLHKREVGDLPLPSRSFISLGRRSASRPARVPQAPQVDLACIEPASARWGAWRARRTPGALVGCSPSTGPRLRPLVDRGDPSACGVGAFAR
jgi:hypothetical protein